MELPIVLHDRFTRGARKREFLKGLLWLLASAPATVALVLLFYHLNEWAFIGLMVASLFPAGIGICFVLFSILATDQKWVIDAATITLQEEFLMGSRIRTWPCASMLDAKIRMCRGEGSNDKHRVEIELTSGRRLNLTPSLSLEEAQLLLQAIKVLIQL